MKLERALEIINATKGYLVAFERKEGPFLVSDYFPDIRQGEAPFSTIEVALKMASKFAKETKNKCINIHIINADDFTPISGYRDSIIINRVLSNEY